MSCTPANDMTLYSDSDSDDELAEYQLSDSPRRPWPLTAEPDLGQFLPFIIEVAKKEDQVVPEFELPIEGNSVETPLTENVSDVSIPKDNGEFAWRNGESDVREVELLNVELSDYSSAEILFCEMLLENAQEVPPRARG